MTKERKAFKGPPMEGFIAKWYAKNTGSNLKRFNDTARAVIERVPPGARVLEIAPGPGYLAIEIAKSGRQVSALDVSRTFVEIARKNADNARVDVDIRHGNASDMPFSGESFDYIVCMAAFKNFGDPLGALNEVHRVLKPGGLASIYDLSKDASWEAIRTEIDSMGLSAPSALVTRLIFRFMLLRSAYTREEIERMARESRFGRCEVVDSGLNFELRLSKPASGDGESGSMGQLGQRFIRLSRSAMLTSGR